MANAKNGVSTGQPKIVFPEGKMWLQSNSKLLEQPNA